MKISKKKLGIGLSAVGGAILSTGVGILIYNKVKGSKEVLGPCAQMEMELNNIKPTTVPVSAVNEMMQSAAKEMEDRFDEELYKNINPQPVKVEQVILESEKAASKVPGFDPYREPVNMDE